MWSSASKDCNFFQTNEKLLVRYTAFSRAGDGRLLSVYSPIERTPGANAFALALDDVVGKDASRIKRGEHSFSEATQLEALLRGWGFNAVGVFPSVLDYVRFQLLATPMTVLLKDRTEPEREAIFSSIASKTIASSRPPGRRGPRN